MRESALLAISALQEAAVPRKIRVLPGTEQELLPPKKTSAHPKRKVVMLADAPKKRKTHPSYERMVVRAVLALDPKGHEASRAAVEKYIMERYPIPNQAIFRRRYTKVLEVLLKKGHITMCKGPNGRIYVTTKCLSRNQKKKKSVEAPDLTEDQAERASCRRELEDKVAQKNEESRMHQQKVVSDLCRMALDLAKQMKFT